MSVSGRLNHFLLLDREQQAALIRRLAAQGWQDHSIATFTGRAVEDIRRILGIDAQILSAGESPVMRERLAGAMSRSLLDPPFSINLRRIGHAVTYGHLQGWHTLLKAVAKAEPNKAVDPMKILLSEDGTSSTGEVALRLVTDAFSRRTQGKIAKVDPIALRTLQALNGYRVWKIDPQSVVV